MTLQSFLRAIKGKWTVRPTYTAFWARRQRQNTSPKRTAFWRAVYFPEENPLLSSLRQIFLPFLCVLVLAGIAAIAVILLLASFFTRKMNRLVMEPVELLVAGAERIRDGNLNEEIRYEGEAEFEHVCRTFNAMQHTILEDQRQREKNEKVRTDMVTGISHDLRTPLTSIRGYIKGVLDGTCRLRTNPRRI